MSRHAGDPLAYVLGALELLAGDPAAASPRDLQRLAAVHAGFQRHVASLERRHRSLARRVSADLDVASIERAADEFAELDALRRRCLRADHRLTTYTAAAFRARGFNLDDPMVADNQGATK